MTCIKELREAGLAVNTEARGPVGTASTEAAEEEEEEQYEDPETVLLLQHKVTLFLSQKLVGKRKKVGSFALQSFMKEIFGFQLNRCFLKLYIKMF